MGVKQGHPVRQEVGLDVAVHPERDKGFPSVGPVGGAHVHGLLLWAV